jgi:hypothetical protein
MSHEESVNHRDLPTESTLWRNISHTFTHTLSLSLTHTHTQYIYIYTHTNTHTHTHEFGAHCGIITQKIYKPKLTYYMTVVIENEERT